MKKIILDFETTNVSVFKAKVLEICALFVENNRVVEEYYKKVRFDFDYNKCDKSTIDALNFNKIFSQKDIDNHNRLAISEMVMIDEFVLKCKNFGKVTITGWNNASYDNVILRRIFEEYNLNFEDIFDYHSRDVYCMLQPFYNELFKNKFHLNLENAHKYLFLNKTESKNFHNANYDCYATLDIDIWIENYLKLKNNEKQIKNINVL